jgi:hypothetical protein
VRQGDGRLQPSAIDGLPPVIKHGDQSFAAKKVDLLRQAECRAVDNLDCRVIESLRVEARDLKPPPNVCGRFLGCHRMEPKEYAAPTHQSTESRTH